MCDPGWAVGINKIKIDPNPTAAAITILNQINGITTILMEEPNHIAPKEIALPRAVIFLSSTNNLMPGPKRLSASIRRYIRSFVLVNAKAAMIQKLVVGKPGRNIPTKPIRKLNQPIVINNQCRNTLNDDSWSIQYTIIKPGY